MIKPKTAIVIETTLDKETADKYRRIILKLIDNRAFDVKYGSSVMHFFRGELKSIDLNIKQWHVDKSP